MLVPARIRAGVQPLPDRYGEVQGGFPDPILEGGTTPPWHTPDNTHGPGTIELCDSIRGESGGVGYSPTPP